jgi:hypothetical protein
VKGGVTLIPAIDIDISFDLSVTVSINPGFSFSVQGSFGWGSQTFTAGFTLQINSWSDLKKALIDFFVKYPEQLFRDLWNDVKKWAQALKDGLFTAVEDVAKVLKNAYNVVATEAVKLLNFLGWGITAIIKALVSIWGLVLSEAEKLVGQIIDSCSVFNANQIAKVPTVYTVRPDMEMLQELTMAPGAQNMLYHYYMNQQLITEACKKDPVVQSRLHRMLEETTGEGAADMPVVEEIITLLHTIRKSDTVKAGDDLEPLLAELRPYRNSNYAQFMQAMQQPEAVEAEEEERPSLGDDTAEH